MLIGTNEVANRLKISNRAVQIKCKRAGLVKIGNQFQITREVAEQWYKIADAKKRTETEPKEKISKSSHRTDAKNKFNSSFLIIILSIVVLMVSILFYFHLKDEIRAYKEQITKKDTMYSNEINKLNKKLFDARDIIHNQELEIQYLKIKDTVRIQSKW